MTGGSGQGSFMKVRPISSTVRPDQWCSATSSGRSARGCGAGVIVEPAGVVKGADVGPLGAAPTRSLPNTRSGCLVRKVIASVRVANRMRAMQAAGRSGLTPLAKYSRWYSAK